MINKFKFQVRDKLFYVLNNGKAHFSLKTIIFSLLLYISTFIVVGVFLYNYFSPLTIIERLAIITTFIITVLITNFFLDNFKYSSYFIIRILQKFVFLILLLLFIIFTLDFFEIINLDVYCEGTDRDIFSSKNSNEGTSTNTITAFNFVVKSSNEGVTNIPIVNILHHLISLGYVELFVIFLLIYLFTNHYINRYTTTLNKKFVSKLFSFFQYKPKNLEGNIEKGIAYN